MHKQNTMKEKVRQLKMTVIRNTKTMILGLYHVIF
jgi:hypothetical protein